MYSSWLVVDGQYECALFITHACMHVGKLISLFMMNDGWCIFADNPGLCKIIEHGPDGWMDGPTQTIHPLTFSQDFSKTNK
mmetsp:Transcript_7398/g.9636  ORF Transcript_7398/g.9636 Transcript_7398/m.9636 type:complete len:81 (+) Transcript_7398:53-295(+)